MRLLRHALAVVVLAAPLPAQDAERPEGAGESPRRHKVGLFVGTSLVPEVLDPESGREQTVVAAAWGLDYEYWLTRRFALATYNEVEFVNFVVEDRAGEALRRQDVYVLSAVGVFAPVRRWTLIAGVGVEIDQSRNLRVGRFGAEHVVLEDGTREVSLALGYVRKEIYDVFSFGVSVGRRFGARVGR
jgi:hypothetical protein